MWVIIHRQAFCDALQRLSEIILNPYCTKEINCDFLDDEHYCQFCLYSSVFSESFDNFSCFLYSVSSYFL